MENNNLMECNCCPVCMYPQQETKHAHEDLTECDGLFYCKDCADCIVYYV